MLGINLSEETLKKILINENREYVKVNGENVKKEYKQTTRIEGLIAIIK